MGNSPAETLALIITAANILMILVNALTSYLSTHSSSKNETKRIELDAQRANVDTEFTNVNAANQLIASGLQQVTLINQIYTDCVAEKKRLEEENITLKLSVADLKIKIAEAVSGIKNILATLLNISKEIDKGLYTELLQEILTDLSPDVVGEEKG